MVSETLRMSGKRLYEYKCKGCGYSLEREFDVERRNVLVGAVCDCGGEFRRVFSFHPASMFHAHYSPFLGKAVESERHFNDLLKRESDAATQRTGIPHNYVKRDMQDLKPPESEATEVVDKSTHDANIAMGKLDQRKMFYG